MEGIVFMFRFWARVSPVPSPRGMDARRPNDGPRRLADRREVFEAAKDLTSGET